MSILWGLFKFGYIGKLVAIYILANSPLVVDGSVFLRLYTRDQY